MALKKTLMLVVGLSVMMPVTNADAYSRRVKSACKSDFYRFCPSYKVGSTKLRNCMRSTGGNLSRRCINALADAGHISKKYKRSRRR